MTDRSRYHRLSNGHAFRRLVLHTSHR